VTLALKTRGQIHAAASEQLQTNLIETDRIADLVRQGLGLAHSGQVKGYDQARVRGGHGHGQVLFQMGGIKSGVVSPRPRFY
jgi:hypothetical protein